MRMFPRCLAVLVAIWPMAALADDAGDIRQLMLATFDKPEARLTVDPITLRDDIAIAGWTQGDMGGRALLRKEAQGWQISVCGGDGLRDPKALEQLGLSPEDAKALASEVVSAEAKLDPATVARFALFQGIVPMGQDAPPAAQN